MKFLVLGLIVLTCSGCGWYYSSTSGNTGHVSVVGPFISKSRCEHEREVSMHLAWDADAKRNKAIVSLGCWLGL